MAWGTKCSDSATKFSQGRAALRTFSLPNPPHPQPHPYSRRFIYLLSRHSEISVGLETNHRSNPLSSANLGLLCTSSVSIRVSEENRMQIIIIFMRECPQSHGYISGNQEGVRRYPKISNSGRPLLPWSHQIQIKTQDTQLNLYLRYMMNFFFHKNNSQILHILIL